MIETEFIKLTDAASMLGVDDDGMLLAAVERTVKAWGLLNEPRKAQKVMHDLTTLDAPSIILDERVWRPMFVPLSKFAAGDILKYGKGHVSLLTIEDEGGAVWSDNEKETAYITKNLVFFKRDDILALLKKDQDKSLKTLHHANVSNKLAMMNQASQKFWANADREERGTHPSNQTVTDWLVKQGFTQTLAGKATTIIRPEWARTGRKPNE